MSFKDDFVEALRSVKRDFFRETEHMADRERTHPLSPAQVSEPENLSAADTPSEVIPAYQPPEIDNSDEEIGADVGGEEIPFRRYDQDPPPISADTDQSKNSSHAYIDFEDSGVYDDSKTIISRQTVVRGALSTDDSIRLLGQVMGDIDCKANIVVAGKVRGNTTAANAYIYDAQVDGDVRCEDIITVSGDAWVLGNIRAQQAEIDGKVKGNMEIRHIVSIGATSSILGDISADELEVKRGAFVNGQIMMYSPSRDVLDRFDRFDES